ncbi:MAG TPA: lysine--tRNA ligase [candidate division Zixibacteria bacterium]|nr:lysine--tRNA ligase [candidate division Zixibacteria bacterium]
MTDRNSHPAPEPHPQSEPSDAQIPLADLIRIRYQKACDLQARGINPYPYRYDRDHEIAALLADFDTLAERQTAVRIAGRVMLIRKMGKVFFADLRDQSDRIQIYLKIDTVGEDQFRLFDAVDLGDIVGCEGTLFVTRTGERTLNVRRFELLTKALHPLPDKRAGLTDVEMRYRRRYADLIANPEVRVTFLKRTAIVQAIRDFFNRRGFLEVETPILQPIYGGASARPFKTHHHKLDEDMYLRIADELYLKRLIVGGFEKVWEYCKDFRNEGMDRLHNPEFSMVEAYWAYADYRDMARLVEELVRHVAFAVHGAYRFTYGEREIDVAPPFRWVSMVDSIREAAGLDLMALSYEQARAEAKKMHLPDEDLTNWGKCVEAIWEAKVEPTLVQPTFIADFPREISPLAKVHRENPRLAERFELFIAGQETANAFSELNDPVDQLRRFIEQGKALAAGDEEAQPLDDDFITALTYGMPPTAGLGLGVDRFVMLLTNQHTIREVLLFPQMKRELADGAVPVSRILARIIGADKETP